MLIVPTLTQGSIYYCLLFRPTVSHHLNWLNRNSIYLVTFKLTVVGSFLRLEQDNLILSLLSFVYHRIRTTLYLL